MTNGMVPMVKTSYESRSIVGVLGPLCPVYAPAYS